jgi:DNA-binding LacI/PurR family transcriptional regulator
MSIGCVSYLINNGYNVPLDISVISTGDVPLFRYFKPSLTAFTINHKEYGKAALDMLLSSIENNSTHISSLKLKLTERQTVSYAKRRV